MKDKNLKKINIPIIFLVADEALKRSITGINFRRWFNLFFDEHKDEYGVFCSSGSIKKEKTCGRLEVMMKYFDAYFHTDEENVQQKGIPKNEIAESADNDIVDETLGTGEKPDRQKLTADDGQEIFPDKLEEVADGNNEATAEGSSVSKDSD